MTNTLAIGRGWAVITADGKRVGDVIEVHDHYLLVSRGVIFVRDRYLPLGTVERVEDKRVILTVTEDMFRKMDLSHIPPPPIAEPSTQPLAQPMAVTEVDPNYTPASYEVDAGNYSTGWQSDSGADYDETPSYTPVQPNGLIQIEHGLNLAYTEIGYGQPVVLVPGWPFDSAVWEPLPTVLAEDYRVVTYDPRGTGKSDAPWDYYSVDAMAGDLHRLIVEQALYEVTVVAWSTGAMVALAYARTFPKRIARLILVAPMVLRWPGDPSPLDWSDDVSSEEPATSDDATEEVPHEDSQLDTATQAPPGEPALVDISAPAEELPEANTPMDETGEEFSDDASEVDGPTEEQSGERSALDESIRESWATQLLEDRPALFRLLVEELVGPELSDPRRHWLWERLMLGGQHAQIKTWEALRTYDLTDSCTDVKAPITIISGRGDRYSPVALGARLAGLLSGATQIEIEGRSHALFLEQRTALVDILNGILNPPYEPGDWADEAEESEPESDDEEPAELEFDGMEQSEPAVDEEPDEEVGEHVAEVEQISSDEPPAESAEPRPDESPTIQA